MHIISRGPFLCFFSMFRSDQCNFSLLHSKVVQSAACHVWTCAEQKNKDDKSPIVEWHRLTVTDGEPPCLSPTLFNTSENGCHSVFVWACCSTGLVSSLLSLSVDLKRNGWSRKDCLPFTDHHCWFKIWGCFLINLPIHRESETLSKTNALKL